MEVLEQPFVIEDMHLDIETSIGITLFPEHGKDADTLIRRADVAMYHAKNKGCGYFIYEAEADPYSMRRLALMGELRYAIEQNELTLHYQPKVDLQTGHTTGVEALLRWNHPQHGFIPPDEFVPLAEHTGLIRPLTLWVLNAALRQSHIWKMMGVDLVMAVNLSARNLQESKLSDQIVELLEAWDVPAASLLVEVTESALMDDHTNARKILTDIKGVGVNASLDDFGTGYSSLVSLSQLPIAEIKIDRSFVMDMTSNQQNAAIVRSTIDLGHNLNRVVTAEGVEDRKTLEALKSMGCDKAQGYFLSRPLPANELVEWLRESEWRIDKRPPQLLPDYSFS
jgi:EAL domain-containing protein (putative c-di-GMP-specific phosphodiesterase class I)